MARNKKRELSVVAHKNVLPIIDLSEDSSTTPNNSTVATRVVVERRPELLLGRDNTLPDLEYHDDEYFNGLNSDDNSTTHFNNKRKNKDIEKEKDTQKKIRKINYYY
jgi:hypothetical protein